MKISLKKPQNIFWNIYKRRNENIFIRALLRVISFFYLIIYKIRLKLYKINIIKKHKQPTTVISIGNITLGGSGKTPLTIEIAKYLIKEGFKVAILSRGYKKRELMNNKNTNAQMVSDGSEILLNHEVSGDEPYLIAKKVPNAIVLTGKDRTKNANIAVKHGAEILILDDGYQHLKIQRDEDILLIDSTLPFYLDELFPLGNLRELPDEISRASTIILTNTDKGNNEVAKLMTILAKYNKPIFKMRYKIDTLKGLNIKKTIDIKEYAYKQVVAFSGIANPYSFIENLKQNNLKIMEHLIYPDHYNYSFGDIKEIINYADKHRVEDIITTEKDAVKIEELCQACPKTFWACELTVSIEDIKSLNDIFNNKSKFTLRQK